MATTISVDASVRLWLTVYTLTADKRNQTTGEPHYLNTAWRAFVRAWDAEYGPSGIPHNIVVYTGRVPLLPKR